MTGPGAVGFAYLSGVTSAAGGGIGEWVTQERYWRLASLGIEVDVMDAAGCRVDRVRAYRVHPAGVEVSVLGTVDGGRLAVLGRPRELEVAHFHGFIPGGWIRVDRKPAS